MQYFPVKCTGTLNNANNVIDDERDMLLFL